MTTYITFIFLCYVSSIITGIVASLTIRNDDGDWIEIGIDENGDERAIYVKNPNPWRTRLNGHHSSFDIDEPIYHDECLPIL